ncbi:4-hydroxy-3-methylbut-2-enyl diphosphate reductase [Candidatus Methylopumilus rimovensis]|uniref:4-hydroxy-3-methylbut-2-enyl diphosphate reductase n=1 Tax=Candidatus Methylopumilus rimovensis TaxID=2588535 RepID=A0AAE6FS76_9PROT|nr:4-hydroxy-3-methylbut-2-enyl diphosphate reductase [Candidatus Methylopumilus rimovensis]QDD12997.1 4-hydroxy-3-methylbut-2-enyl diphosphate reductase [Candidatus Methylopumilus rimovensis]
MADKINILLANPRGFCAGVDRAIQIVEEALAQYGKPIYVRHEVVHNQYVINDLKTKGAIFIEDLNDVPKGAHVIFSAHGISKAIREEAKSRQLIPIDATCPLVTKVHVEVNKMLSQDMDIIMIGHQGHPEVEGTMGQIEEHQAHRKMYLIETIEDVKRLIVDHPDKVAYVTQTTLSIDDTKTIIEALKTKYPNIQGPKSDDICYATQNRQDAVKAMSGQCDLIIIVGSHNSSNSNRLKELASREGVEAYMIDHEDALQSSWLLSKKNIGISAGASAPEISVKNIVNKIESLTKANITELPGVEESIVFRLPKI